MDGRKSIGILLALSLAVLIILGYLLLRKPDWQIPQPAAVSVSTSEGFRTGLTSEAGPKTGSDAISELDNMVIPGYVRIQEDPSIAGNLSEANASQQGRTDLGLPSLSGEAGSMVKGSEFTYNLDDALKRQQANGLPVLVIFMNSFDFMCLAFRNEAFSDNGFIRIVTSRASICVIDMDRRPGDVAKMRVSIPPTFLILGTDAQEMARKEGFSGVDNFLEWFRNRFR
ncbi:MAG: hypothetical protein CVV64_08970 [Candidatus Wallbacteria bacterium HGW-Wallbacteria-1]|jgi:hypothetical protein|uniref:Thioredoxin domain-containing protein n=1 Tax=Candidatus Wallbacteria bacterium HGW-Wallbacteria-1 TaxID=2013854 RepID=A0A2N1PQ78_9BACT|nr:MAG: hypothetical protein CVV64_08970 [Candidatus Wallbacteria bacterium HGW-Wallbacteria-1]